MSEKKLDKETETHLKQQRERRLTRHRILGLIRETEDHHKEMIQPGSELTKTIEKGNEIFKQIVHSREGALDSQFIRRVSEFSVEKTNAMHVGQVLNPKEFCDKVQIKYSQNGELDLKSLGTDYAKYFMRSPSVTFMFGPIKSEPKQKKEREKKKRAKFSEEAEAPEEIKVQEQQVEDTTKRVREIYTVLDSKLNSDPQHATFIDVAIDLNSFTKTIENIFHLGFLVKDGKVGMKSGMKLDKHEEATEEEQKLLNNKQSVLKLDLANWNAMKRKREEEK